MDNPVQAKSTYRKQGLGNPTYTLPLDPPLEAVSVEQKGVKRHNENCGGKQKTANSIISVLLDFYSPVYNLSTNCGLRSTLGYF